MVKKRGLGRGLDTLLGVQEEIESSQQTAKNRTDRSAGLTFLPIDQVQRGAYQPRRHFDQQALEELADSIRSQGLLQPIVVRTLGEQKYEIIAGERRWRAAQLAGLADISAVIKNIPDEEAIAVALIENIQRENLNPVEEAETLHRLQKEFGLTHEEVAKAVGKSRSAVTNTLRLVQLPETVRKMLETRELEMGHARALLGLDKSLQQKTAIEVVKRRLSVRQTEALVRTMSQPKTPSVVATKADADIASLEQQLGDKLGARVNIHHSKAGKGRLTINYGSTNELQGILKHLGVD